MEHILIFGFEAAINRSWLMDKVSMVDNSVSTTELLDNPGFGDSNTSATGWGQWCSSHCHYGINSCLGPSVEFLGQSTSEMNYTISFLLSLIGIGGHRQMMFYADIF